MQKNNPYRLPRTTLPVKYDIELTPNLKDFKFKGEETIELDVLEDTKTVVLNSNDLKIEQAEIKNQKAVKIDLDKDKQTASLSFTETINKGKTTLKIKFSGELKDTLRGFYRSEYEVNGKKEIMATTQFEPNDARNAFPCFDEPSMKAKFKITLNIPKDLTAISNMPITNETANEDLKKVEFAETPICSTYLIAFIIGKFEYVENKTKDGTIVRVYTTPGKKEQGRFALDVGIKSLEYYNNYFGIKYPLPKMDMIAIPDFEAGAMENWGAITYRETALLVDKEHSSIATKQRVGTIVTHEIAHQWFGNLVTMDWWNDLWLNEGFASWMEFKCLDYIFPEWDLWTQFVNDDTNRAFALDGLETSHKIEAEVTNPNEIGEIFDAVSYSKGASIIRMLEEYLGEETFKKGLQDYIEKFKYSNTVTEDLWQALSNASEKDVKKLMDTWTKQMGYPIITITPSDNRIKLTQQRFLFTGKKDAESLWNIPISISKDKYIEMNEKEIEINAENFLHINISQTGFYRTRYHKKLFDKIISAISEGKISTIDKLGLLSNTYALAKASYIPITQYFDLTKEYTKEEDFTIWSDITGSLLRTQDLFYNKPFVKNLNKFSRKLLQNIVEKIGWESKESEKHTDKLLRSTVLSAAGFSENQEILDEANKRFQAYLQGSPIEADLRSVVYSLVAQTGDKETFEKMKQLYIDADLQEEKIRLLSALGMFKQEEILKDALDFSLSKHVRSQDTITGFARVALNPASSELSWNFLTENWKTFKSRYGSGTHMMPYFIKTATRNFSNLEGERKVKEFFKANPVPNAKMALSQALETIRINHNFIIRNEQKLEAWLK